VTGKFLWYGRGVDGTILIWWWWEYKTTAKLKYYLCSQCKGCFIFMSV
jgi:hypothetical protein